MNDQLYRGLKFAIPLALTAWALIFASVACANETNPNAPTPKLEWVYQGAAFVDMLTTLDIRHTDLHELNPVLGEHPNDAQVIGYFVATGVLHYLLTRELVRESVPSPIVNAWEAGTIGLELGMVGHNYSIGLRARF